jgi:hypothetical protein
MQIFGYIITGFGAVFILLGLVDFVLEVILAPSEGMNGPGL